MEEDAITEEMIDSMTSKTKAHNRPPGVYCSSCGTGNAESARFCNACGAPLIGVPDMRALRAPRPPSRVNRVAPQPTIVYIARTPKSKSTAALLAILLGGLGLHKFYLDNPIMGVVYILFCWTFIPAIVGVIEGLIYAFMSEESFDRQYNGITG